MVARAENARGVFLRMILGQRHDQNFLRVLFRVRDDNLKVDKLVHSAVGGSEGVAGLH
jgi:hypothetical protein